MLKYPPNQSVKKIFFTKERMMSFFIDAQEQSLCKLHGREPQYAENIQFLKDSFESFLAREVAPRAYQNDIEEIFSPETFAKLGEVGFLGLPHPEKFGGLGLPFTYYCAGLESLSKADSGFALGVAIHGTVTDGILHYASEEVKAKYLPDLISGKKIACFGLTETTSGSDAQNMATNFRYDKATSEYILNGTKYWITNGMSCDVFFIMARGEDGKVSAFVIDKSGQGTFEQHKILDKMGVRSSNTAELVFQDYRIPAYSLVGEVGKGFKYAMRMLNGGRITIGAWSTGIAQAAYEKLIKYAHERKLFGKLLRDLDNTKKELSEMLIEIYASRELYQNAAYFKEDEKTVAQNAAISKVKATEAAVHICERAIQLCGAYGYVRDSKIERHLRDALLGPIGEGSNEVLKIAVLPKVLYQEFEKKPLTSIW